MYSDTRHYRDGFSFSLRGIGVTNAYVMVPAIAGHGINRAWDARLGRLPKPATPARQQATTQQIETLLARYFAPGCCSAA